MKKRLLSALLCVAMIASLVVGCGAKEEAPAAEAPAATEEAAAPEKEPGTYPIVDEAITVKGLVVNAGAITGEDRSVWKSVSEITNVNFEWTVIDLEALNTFLAGDWDFDFIHYRNLDSAIINDYGVLGGKFANYKDYAALMPNLQQTFKDFPEAEKAVTETNGEIYELPFIEIAATSTQVRPYYRTDLLEKYDIPVPTTTEELYQALKTYKEKNGTAGFSGYALNETNYWGTMLYSAFGTSVQPDFEDDGTGKVVFNRTSEQYKHYLEYMAKLYKEGLIQPEYMTNDNAVALGLASEGATFCYGTEAHGLGADVFEDGEFALSVMAPLTSEYSDDQEILRQLTVAKGGMFLNAESEYLEELVQVFDIMYATEEIVEGSGLHGMSFCYGIDGVDYIKHEDGTYDFVWPEEYASSTEYTYGEVIWDITGRATDLEGYITSSPGNAQARQIGFRDNVFPYACDASKVFPTSFLKLETDEQDVITTRYTDISTYVTEMRDKFIQGVVDVEAGWEDYCNAIEQMHIDEVLEVYQAAYDRWNQK